MYRAVILINIDSGGDRGVDRQIAKIEIKDSTIEGLIRKVQAHTALVDDDGVQTPAPERRMRT